MDQTDVLIIGCGIAGATAALRLARNPDRKILVITRDPDPHESNSRYAQGGIIGRGQDDERRAAGQGYPGRRRGGQLAQNGAHPGGGRAGAAGRGPGRNGRRSSLTASRTANPNSARKRPIPGGASCTWAMAPARRSSTGLVAAMRRCPNITILTNMTAVDLITFPHHSRDPLATYEPLVCHGAFAFDRKARTVHRYIAAATILATGGLGRIYRNTTNPTGARGDGLAMANRAGARIVNAEYVQFHPTTLAVPGAEGFLISEAVRGEGGVLLTPDGTRLHGGLFAPMERPGPARRGGARHPSGDGNPRLFLRAAGYRLAPGRRRHPRPLPQHLCQMPAGRHRHHQRADPGGAGGALFLRRRAGG